MPKKKGQSAWLITWEVVGSHVIGAKRGRKKYAAILNPNSSHDVICSVMESLYAYSNEISLFACLDYAKIKSAASTSSTRQKSKYPHLAKYNPHKGTYMCGDGLHLLARRVDELQVIEENGREKPVWKDRPFEPSLLMKKLLRNEA